MTHLCLKTSFPVLCVLMALVCMASGDTCDLEIKNCHTPLRKYSNETYNFIVLFTAASQEHLDEICGVYDGVKQCVVNIKHHCSAETLTKFDGLDNVYEYICGEGNNAYLRFRSCMLKDDLLIKQHKCYTDYKEILDNAPIYYCSYDDDYLSCNEKLTKLYCGDEAESFDRHLNRLYYGPDMRHYNCPGWEAEKKPGTEATGPITRPVTESPVTAGPITRQVTESPVTAGEAEKKPGTEATGPITRPVTKSPVTAGVTKGNSWTGATGTSTRPVTGSLVAATFLCWFLLYVMREF